LQNRILGLLGLSEKAGKIRSGEFQVEKSVKGGKSCLVILSTDASENTKKKFRNMCTFRQVPIAEYGTKEELGHALGRSERSALSMEDSGFAEKLIGLIDGGNVNVG
jgi:ribosomal protein L7Ae-like RNA K-turn-binding protein